MECKHAIDYPMKWVVEDDKDSLMEFVTYRYDGYWYVLFFFPEWQPTSTLPDFSFLVHKSHAKAISVCTSVTSASKPRTP